MNTPPLHAEVERLGLDEIVEKARILLTDRDWLLDATEDLIALEPELNNEQRRFLLAIGLDDPRPRGRGPRLSPVSRWFANGLSQGFRDNL